uniref:Helicase ATP-binding domain-containing protein n=1 Tax=Arcella intermedia TaxID=1963864 RepID=A0A6B2KX32_9EUKA
MTTIAGDELSEDRKACQHEMCLPPGWTGETDANLSDTMPKKPARVYPFELDPFQKVAVACIEKNHSVLVSAHTSAGKTVVAEYAIAAALREQQRVIYTSPIKALSNQKYRDLEEIFKDVGLMTGDVSINPSASCLVMTTEILRSMLYRGSEILREIGWVIFDEIHYMRDKERGVVWEETIILLPDTIKFVFLSATIPNAREFASWIALIHNQPCHVVYTDYRPTPLQHYIFPSGGNGLYLVVDEKGKFREDNFQLALGSMVMDNTRKKEKERAGTDCYKIVKVIQERGLDPVIVFTFSKTGVEDLAKHISTKLDFNDENEKQLVDSVFNNAIDVLNEDDRKLPQIVKILPLLKRGIGIHHSGLLPLLKEVIEILFQEGLIKCLFATETFAMGLNMPAKTVVFASIRKFDGTNSRWLSGGEYIQMSGRAGRRGKDSRGIVILMVGEKMEPKVAQSMVKGQSDVLQSQFHIGYNMLLNLLRVEGIDPIHMLKQSFRQYQNDKQIPAMKATIDALEKQAKALVIPNDKLIAEYFNIRKQLESNREEIRKIIHQPFHALPFLQQGRLVRVRSGETDWGWGVVVNFQKSKKSDYEDKGQNGAAGIIVDVLLPCEERKESLAPPKPASSAAVENGTADYQVIPVVLELLLDGISSVRIFLPKDLTSIAARQSVAKSLQEVFKGFPDGVPLLDPIEDMKIEDATFTKVIRHVEALEDRLRATKFAPIASMGPAIDKYKEKLALEAEMKELKKKIKNTENVILQNELKSMKRVLRRLGFLSKDNVVDVKGRVAAEINVNDELVLTEMLFSGFFTDLNVHQIVALMSCFVVEENSTRQSELQKDMQTPLLQLHDIARRVATVSKEAKLEIEVEDYVQKFKPYLMDAMYAWTKGASFAEICTMTDIFEGSIIRIMRRLEELLRQLVVASKSIGNTELEAKATEAIVLMKRDIAFAASLYL